MANPIPTADPAQLQQVVAKWKSRAAQLKASGFDPAKIEPLYQQDYAKVAAGGAPMTLDAAQASVDAAYRGTGPVTKGRTTGPMGVVRNIPTDLGSILWNAPRGLFDLVHHFPSEVRDVGRYLGLEGAQGRHQVQMRYGLEVPHGDLLSHLGVDLRDLARLPLTSLIPGVWAAGMATSASGRRQLQQHPVGTFLDVLPAVGGVTGRLAEAGALGGSGETLMLGKVAAEADKLVSAGRIDVADQVAQAHGFDDYLHLAQNTPSASKAMEALAAGRPLKATIRAVPFLDQARVAVLDHFNLTPLATGYRRGIVTAEAATSREFVAGIQDEVLPMVQHKSPEEIDRLFQLAQRAPNMDSAEWSQISAEDQTFIATLRKYQDAKAMIDATDQHLTPFTVRGREVFYGGQDAERLTRLKDIHLRRIDAAQRADEALHASPEDPKLVEASQKAHDRLDVADRNFNNRLARTVPPQYHALVQDQIRQKYLTKVAQDMGPDTVEYAKAVSAYDRNQPLGQWVDARTLAKYTVEARKEWQNYIDTHNPVWIHSASPDTLSRALNPVRFRDQPITPGVWKSKALNQLPGSTDLMLALAEPEMARLRYRDNLAAVDHFVRPVAKTTSQIDEELSSHYAKLRSAHPITTSDAHVQDVLRKKAYTPLDSSLGLGDTPALSRLYDEKLWIPNDLATAIRKHMAPPTENELQRLNMKTIRLFKTAVIRFSPTHQAHIWLGSMLPLMMGGGIEELNPARLAQAFKIATGKAEMPDLLNRSVDVLDTQDISDFMHGKLIGRLAAKVRGAPALSRSLSEIGQNMYRSWAYLSEEARQLREVAKDPMFADLSDSARRDIAQTRGLAYANKAFVDISGLAPIEQVLVRNVFPFYAYCADKDTQALTKRGWVSGWDVNESDDILSMNPKTGCLHWSPVKSVFRNPDYAGPMHRMKGQKIDALVTPNHTWPLIDGQLRKVQELRYEDRIRVMGEEVDGPTVFSDAFVELVGWTVTEGHYKKNSAGNVTTIEISQKATSPEVEEIRRVLKTSGARWHEFLAGVDHQIRYFGVTGSMTQLLKEAAPGRVMTPEFLCRLSAWQRRQLIDVMLRADGSRAKRSGRAVNPTAQFSQKSKEMTDAFVMLCSMSGIPTTTTWRLSDVWITTLRRNTPKTTKVGLLHDRSVEQYQGLVWCPETEYGTFVMRRNGIVCVTGNTRWALRYLMQYPIDHPIRASILSRLGEQEATYNSAHGIANTMSMLFNFGRPDSKGDQWGTQLRAFNPFRDMASTFTLGGILRALGPVERAVISTTGVNTLSGTPDPFPGIDIDPNTGALVGTVKGASPLTAAEQIVPQLSALDHYLGLSQQARSLRTSDPAAFRRQVFSIFNMPFVPQSYTPTLTAAAHARDQLRVAQNAVSAALKSHDLSSLSVYNQLPLTSKLKPYFNGASFATYAQLAPVVERIWKYEQATGQKII